MCRMIAAQGKIDPPALRRALMMMAANENPGYSHEHRAEGIEFRHEDGWGAAWLEHDALRARRSPVSMLLDPKVSEIDALATDLLILHVRRATKPRSVRLANTHPFLLRRGETTWAFCHNGSVKEIKSLTPPRGSTPQGGTDSEALFHHLLLHLDEEEPRESIFAALASIQDYTAMHSFLMNPRRILAISWRHPEKGQLGYHALWEGRGDGLRVVSSEPLEEIGCEDWRRIEEPGLVILQREGQKG
jgi:predicted glutamine amidotransferase